MNVFFVDIDGVLNTYHSEGFICEDKVKVLQQLTKMYDAKVVIESTHKPIPFMEENTGLKELYELFAKYDIELLGFTPSISVQEGIATTEVYKDFEIMHYLLGHSEIEHFCIIDDNDSTDLALLSEYLIEVRPYDERGLEYEGITLDYVEEIGNILNKENKYQQVIQKEKERKRLVYANRGENK